MYVILVGTSTSKFLLGEETGKLENDQCSTPGDAVETAGPAVLTLE